MCEGWSIEEVFPGSGSCIYQLQAASSDKTLLERFAAKKQNREASLKLASTLDLIRKSGIARSVGNMTIRRVEGDIVEVRVSGTVIRAFSYQRNGEDALVLLDIERTHQGSGSIRRHIEAAKPKAEAARALLAKMKGEGRE